MNASAVAEAATLPRCASRGPSVGTLARSATGSCDERVSGSGLGDASEVCVEGTFVGTFARSATGSADERVSGSGSGDASEVCVEGTFGRNVGTFRYGELR